MPIMGLQFQSSARAKFRQLILGSRLVCLCVSASACLSLALSPSLALPPAVHLSLSLPLSLALIPLLCDAAHFCPALPEQRATLSSKNKMTSPPVSFSLIRESITAWSVNQSYPNHLPRVPWVCWPPCFTFQRSERTSFCLNFSERAHVLSVIPGS